MLSCLDESWQLIGMVVVVDVFICDGGGSVATAEKVVVFE
jgi:hypothetical protein